MYGSANNAEATKRHLGALADASYGRDETPYGVVTGRIQELVDRNVIDAREAEDVIFAFKAWMMATPENMDALAHAEQFYAEYENSQFSYIPEPYPLPA